MRHRCPIVKLESRDTCMRVQNVGLIEKSVPVVATKND
jgi:hypothetical protein